MNVLNGDCTHAEKQDPPSFALEVANNPYRDQMQLRCCTAACYYLASMNHVFYAG
jgi:hypothetical protein